MNGPPSGSINIQFQPRFRKYDMDDQDGADLLNMISRSLDQFNESLRHDKDSAYETAASSFTNARYVDGILSEELGKVLRLQNAGRFAMSREENSNYTTSSPTSKNCFSHLQQSSQDKDGLNRRRMQSCSSIQVNVHPEDCFRESTADNLNSVFPPQCSFSPTFKMKEQLHEPPPGFLDCAKSPLSPQNRTNLRFNTSSLTSPHMEHSFCDNASDLLNLTKGGGSRMAKCHRACSFYLRGHCKKEDCEFAHDLRQVTCRFWEAGSCYKGTTCPFLHGYPPGGRDPAADPLSPPDFGRMSFAYAP